MKKVLEFINSSGEIKKTPTNLTMPLLALSVDRENLYQFITSHNIENDLFSFDILCKLFIKVKSSSGKKSGKRQCLRQMQ